MNPSDKSAPHQRQHGSLLANREKQLLLWIARRLPQRTSPDHLSLLGLAAMVAAGIFFWASSFHSLWLVGVVVALGVNWFGDSLDGTLARVRDQQRPRYGFYVDHVLDVAGAAFLFGGMALSAHMSTTLGLTLLIAYLMVSAESYLATHARSVFKLSFMRIGPTELRLLLAVGAVRLMVDPAVGLLGRDFRLFDVGGVAATIGLLFAFVVSALRNTASLYREEPVPARQSRRQSVRQARPQSALQPGQEQPQPAKPRPGQAAASAHTPRLVIRIGEPCRVRRVS